MENNIPEDIQREVATAIYRRCVELAKGQGDVVYDVDFKEIFSPYGVKVDKITKYIPKPVGAKIVLNEYEDGLSVAEIMAKTGYTENTVRRYISEYRDKKIPKLSTKIKIELKKGTKKADIARAFGVSRQYVSSLNKRLKTED